MHDAVQVAKIMMIERHPFCSNSVIQAASADNVSACFSVNVLVSDFLMEGRLSMKYLGT